MRFGFVRRLFCLLLLLGLPLASLAQFNYYTQNSQIFITGYNGPGGAVSIPSTIDGLPVTRIWEWAFYDQPSLTSVTIPSSVTSIGKNAFFLCSGLSSVTIPNSVTSIGDEAFSDCDVLTSVTIPNGVTSIGNGVFALCTSLSSVTIPDSVTSIGESAFSNCSSLTILPIGNSVTNIGPGAFFHCTGLRSITIPNRVTSIGHQVFSDCTGLTNVTIPNSVTSIGGGAFANCTGLSSVTIPNSVTDIGDSAFYRCTSLSAITVEALNTVYSSVDGVLFNKSQTALIQYPGGKTGTYTIPNGVTNIGDYAFHFCTRLSSVTIPNSVTSIGAGAFRSCTGLSSVQIGIGVTNVGRYAFFGCTSLTSVTIPNSVTGIGYWAFEDCTSLTGVYFSGRPPSADSSVFLNANQAKVYYLPTTTGWGSTFGGRPAILWNPQALTSDSNFGVRAGQFGFTITGTAGITVVVESTPELANSIWTAISTNVLIGGGFSVHRLSTGWAGGAVLSVSLAVVTHVAV